LYPNWGLELIFSANSKLFGFLPIITISLPRVEDLTKEL